MPGLRVFEMGHPATQERKRQRLAAADIEIPDTVNFVPVDFETDSLADELESVGLLRTDPAVIVWLGVVFYLTSDAVLATLDYVAGQTGSTEVVLEYLQPATTVEGQIHLEQRANSLAAAGEPWFSCFTPRISRPYFASADSPRSQINPPRSWSIGTVRARHSSPPTPRMPARCLVRNTLAPSPLTAILAISIRLRGLRTPSRTPCPTSDSMAGKSSTWGARWRWRPWVSTDPRPSKVNGSNSRSSARQRLTLYAPPGNACSAAGANSSRPRR